MKRIGLLLLVAIAGCGDDLRPCDYVEANDLVNGDIIEPTSLTVGVRARDVCGAIDNAHFDPVGATIDTDTYRVHVAGSGDLLVELWAEDTVALLSSFSVRLFDTADNPRLLAAGVFDPALGDHGAFRASVAPGDYDVVVAGTAAGDLSGSIPYRVRIEPGPAARCPTLTRAPDYAEAHDGDASTGNDVLDLDDLRVPVAKLTPEDDAAEPTALALESSSAYRLTGTSSAITHAGRYLDRDTFEVTTSEHTNQLIARLDWDSRVTDLDFVVLERDTLARVATANTASPSEHELAVFAVKPATAYYVWVGAFAGTSAPATATTFDLTICGDHFFH